MTNAAAAADAGSPSRARTVARNVAVSAAAQVISTFSVLAVTPFFVIKLGLDGYGLWALLSSVVRYGFLADFGLGPTIVKYAAEYVARNERERLAQIMTFGAIFPLAMGAICVGAVSGLAPSLLAVFKIPTELRASAPGLLTTFLAYLFLFMASNVLTALLKGIGRLDVSAVTNAAGLLSFAFTGALLVSRGFGIGGLIEATYVQVGVTVLLNYAHLRKLYGPMFCNPLTIDAGTIRDLFRMSGWIQLSVLLNFLGAETTTVIVGIFLSVAAVGILDIGGRLARGLSAVGYHFYNAFLPAVAQLQVESGTDAAYATAVDGSRYVGLVSVASLGLLIASCPLILRVWLRDAVADVRQVAIVVAILSATWVIGNIAGAGTTVLRAVGRPRLEATAGAIAAVSNLALTLAFAVKFGLVGVLCASLLSSLAGATYFIYRFDGTVSSCFARSLLGWLPNLALATALGAAATAALVAALPPQAVASRIAALFALLAVSVVYTVLLISVLGLFRFFRPFDLALAKRVAPKAALRFLHLRAVQRLFAVTS